MNIKYSDRFNTKFFEWLTNSFKKKFFIQNIRITFVILYIYINSNKNRENLQTQIFNNNPFLQKFHQLITNLPRGRYPNHVDEKKKT